MSTAAAIQIERLSYSYPDGSPALREISLRVGLNEKLAVVGGNGAGKSTLLLHLNGILRGQGQILVHGRRICSANLPEIRRRVGLLFQDPDDQLFCTTVAEDVAFGPRHLGVSPAQIRPRTQAALAAVGLSGVEGRSPRHLSLGERRRAALATVLAMEPDILALDEPLSNLDPHGQRTFLKLLGDLDRTLVLVTHDLALARTLCPRAAILHQGRLVADGPVDDVLADQAQLRRWALA